MIPKSLYTLSTKAQFLQRKIKSYELKGLDVHILVTSAKRLTTDQVVNENAVLATFKELDGGEDAVRECLQVFSL